ncbi:hypothetical protein NXS19_012714 [Fusarium pseudograminearum]|nr:hypothetical protein NXS19_012714 [Fusarium pseudograminearum]
MMFTMSRPSALTCVIIAASLSLFLVVFTFFQESLEVPWTYVHNKAEEYINTNTNTTATTTPTSSLYVSPQSVRWRITLFFHPAEDKLGIVSWLTLTIILNFIQTSTANANQYSCIRLQRSLPRTWLSLHPR